MTFLEFMRNPLGGFAFGLLLGFVICTLLSTVKRIKARIQRYRDERLQRYQDGDSYNEAGR